MIFYWPIWTNCNPILCVNKPTVIQNAVLDYCRSIHLKNWILVVPNKFLNPMFGQRVTILLAGPTLIQFRAALGQLWGSSGPALGQLWDSSGTARKLWDNSGAALGQL